MIKYLFFLFSTLSFSLLNLFDQQSVEITNNFPDYMVAGNVYDVDIVVKKGEIGGFAKFQMDVPDGINVRAVETKNSSFTFKSNVVKNIWMKVPEENEILLSYKIEVAPNFRGSGNFNAEFVFIKDNERYSVAMETKQVRIGDGSDLAAGGEEILPAFNPDKISISRSINALGNNEFEVNIKIVKDGLEGFAKVQDILPEGFEARPMRTSKSVFSIVEDKIKFIWFNIPPEEFVEVSYLLISKYPVTSSTLLNGSFNYLYNDEARQIDFAEEKLIDFVDVADRIDEEPVEPIPTETTVALVAPTVIAKDTEPENVEPEKVETIEPEIIVAASTLDTVQVEKEPVVAEKTEEPEIIVEEVIPIPEPQTDIFYRVQIAAGKQNVRTAYIKKKHNFNNNIYLENHQGWFKYTTGNYQEYASARNRREEIKQMYQFKGPFVTAYNSGERITVQEALLISKQKWVK